MTTFCEDAITTITGTSYLPPGPAVHVEVEGKGEYLLFLKELNQEAEGLVVSSGLLIWNFVEMNQGIHADALESEVDGLDMFGYGAS